MSEETKNSNLANTRPNPVPLSSISCETPIAKEIYNANAERYANKVDTAPWNAGIERPATISILPTDLKGKRVLDAACGPGYYTEFMINLGAEVIGVDVSSEMLTQYRRRTQNKVKTIEHDLSKPLEFFNDKEFDLILSALTLHYLPDWNTVFKEFNRILKNGGIWVFSIPHPAADFYEYHKGGNYFERELVVERWKGFGEPVLEMKLIRRPLGMLFDAILNNGFILEKFIEAQATQKFLELSPEHYEKMRKLPTFISLRVRKI